MSDEQISYRDYLILTAARVAHSLNEATSKAILMQDESYAIRVLESALATAQELAKVGETTDRVAPKPEMGL